MPSLKTQKLSFPELPLQRRNSPYFVHDQWSTSQAPLYFPSRFPKRVLQLETALLARCRRSIEFNLRVDPKGSETSTLCRPRWGKVNEEISNVFQMGRQAAATTTRHAHALQWWCVCERKRARDWNDSNCWSVWVCMTWKLAKGKGVELEEQQMNKLTGKLYRPANWKLERAHTHQPWFPSGKSCKNIRGTFFSCPVPSRPTVISLSAIVIPTKKSLSWNHASSCPLHLLNICRYRSYLIATPVSVALYT